MINLIVDKVSGKAEAITHAVCYNDLDVMFQIASNLIDAFKYFFIILECQLYRNLNKRKCSLTKYEDKQTDISLCDQ